MFDGLQMTVLLPHFIPFFLQYPTNEKYLITVDRFCHNPRRQCLIISSTYSVNIEEWWIKCHIKLTTMTAYSSVIITVSFTTILINRYYNSTFIPLLWQILLIPNTTSLWIPYAQPQQGWANGALARAQYMKGRKINKNNV